MSGGSEPVMCSLIKAAVPTTSGQALVTCFVMHGHEEVVSDIISPTTTFLECDHPLNFDSKHYSSFPAFQVPAGHVHKCTTT